MLFRSGSIKNYSWKARPDGGYDCTTNIISMGEVVESLKVNYTPFNTNLPITTKGLISPNIGIDASSMTELSSSYSQNILAGIFYELREIVGIAAGGFGGSDPRGGKADTNGHSYPFDDSKYKSHYDLFRITINIEGGENATDDTGKIGKTEIGRAHV